MKVISGEWRERLASSARFFSRRRSMGASGHPFLAAGPCFGEFFELLFVGADKFGEVVVVAGLAADALGQGRRVERGQQHVADMVIGSGGVGGDAAARAAAGDIRADVARDS
ncbi:hypothetical protein Hesp01_41620 [Herbidospora sp. NBRC 101105]|nr:hypothetical protein Hesp01_41620 [Herbidospora sp. NBRC 101105]